MPAHSSTVLIQQCAQCQTPFTCGSSTEGAPCWCMNLPFLTLEQTDFSSGCLCPTCLKAKIAAVPVHHS